MTTGRHWGILRIANEPGRIEMFQQHLPEGHTVIAIRPLDDDINEVIVSGPDMPIVEEGKDPERTDVMTQIMEDGTYCYWCHATYKRWRVA